MIDFTYRPIDVWPGVLTPDHQRKFSPFRGSGGRPTSWSTTLDDLDRELWNLHAKNIVLQLAMRESDIRLDGRPRANARQPDHPGVIIAFDSKHGPLKYATDTFRDWQANVRAIALGLEALRRVDRYGITKRGEQYTGWKALAQHSATMTREQAAEFIAMHGGDYITAARKLHPDAGGSHEEFTKLQEARRLLDV